MRRLLSAAAILGLAAILWCPATAGPKTYLRVAGSNTMLPVARLWADKFESAHPTVDVVVKGGGTGVGISMLIAGRCDIACASSPASSSEINAATRKGVRLRLIPVARDAVAIMVSPQNKIARLTLAQLRLILEGKVTNWNRVGGSNLRVTAIGRDQDSGTYRFLQRTILAGRPYRRDMLRMPTNLAICQTVTRRSGAIGYSGDAYARSYAEPGRLRIVPVASGKGPAVMPTRESVGNGRYPLSRTLYLYAVEKPQPQVREFLKLVLSAEGQKLVTKADFVQLAAPSDHHLEKPH